MIGLPPLAAKAAALLAVDPAGLGGLRLRAAATPLRSMWLDLLRALLPAGTPWLRLPAHVDDDHLLGGLDLTATLARGEPVLQWGLLARADGGVALLPMAERAPPSLAARLAHALDGGEVVLQRHGFDQRRCTRFAVVALDDGGEGDEPVPAALNERLALQLDLERLRFEDAGLLSAPTSSGVPARSVLRPGATAIAARSANLPSATQIAAARRLLPTVSSDEPMLEAIAATALALGVDSPRATWLALRTARVAAALAGRTHVLAEDIEPALQLVLLPRATRWPAEATQHDDAEDEAADQDQAEAEANADAALSPPPPASAESGSPAPPQDPSTPPDPLPERLIAAALASLPSGMLDALRLAAGPARRAPSAASVGRRGEAQASRARGRIVGVRAQAPRGGARLNLVETLRAAAPWQRIRQAGSTTPGRGPGRVAVRQSDLRISRHQQHRATTTLFVVDASGSSALHRMAEAKGAVELLLADCYARRDRVALVAFRGRGAQLLLPPTRALARARRCLAALPGGGGTPLASGLDLARATLEPLSRAGDSLLMVLLTDGRANVARDGRGGRAQAQAEAMEAATRLGRLGIAVLVVDTSPQPAAATRDLAGALRGRHLALPHARAETLSRAVQQAQRG